MAEPRQREHLHVLVSPHVKRRIIERLGEFESLGAFVRHAVAIELERREQEPRS